MYWYIWSTLPLAIFLLGPVTPRSNTYLVETGPNVGEEKSTELQIEKGLSKTKKKKLLDRIKASDFSDYQFTQGELVIKRNNLLYTLPALGKQFNLYFEVYINKFGPNVQNILHFTSTGNNCCNVGDRIPGVWAVEHGYLHISYALNGNGNQFGEVAVRSREWISVQISQTLINNRFVYEIRINSKSVYKLDNNRAQVFKNVKVYAGDNFHPPIDGKIRRLYLYRQGSQGEVLDLIGRRAW